jgi:hypothetical protein
VILIGIDPGTTTGLARWDAQSQRFLTIESMAIHKAMESIGRDSRCVTAQHLVMVEDARKRQWFGKMDREQAKYGAAVREGAGAAKRDASIWDDFLADLGIPYLMTKPKAYGTKWTAEYFKRVTGWAGRSNEHMRDAAALVAGMNDGMAAGLLRQFEQTRGTRK